MSDDAVEHLPRQVEAAAILFQLRHHARTLLIVLEAAGAEPVQRALTRMAERRVAQIMRQCNGFGEVLVQAQGPRNGPRDLAHFQRVRQTRAVMVALRRKEHLRLLLQPAECLAMDDAVPVPLKAGP